MGNGWPWTWNVTTLLPSASIRNTAWTFGAVTSLPHGPQSRIPRERISLMPGEGSQPKSSSESQRAELNTFEFAEVEADPVAVMISTVAVIPQRNSSMAPSGTTVTGNTVVPW